MNEIMTVIGAALYMKITPTTVYNLINKGKLKKMEISTVDKPGVSPAVRIGNRKLIVIWGSKTGLRGCSMVTTSYRFNES